MEQVNDGLNLIAPYLSMIAPYLGVVAYVGAALLAIAVLAFLIRMLSGKCNALLKTTGRLLILLAVLSLIYWGLDAAAGAGHVAQFSFFQQPFWMFVLILLIPGLLFRMFASLRPTRE